MVTIKFAKSFKSGNHNHLSFQQINNSFSKIVYSFSQDFNCILNPSQRIVLPLDITGLCDDEYNFLISSANLWQKGIAINSFCPTRKNWSIELVNFTNEPIQLTGKDLVFNILLVIDKLEADIEEWTFEEIQK